MKNTVTVVDFGTSKIVALIAEVSGKQRCDIVGAGITYYDGFADARWNNPDMVNETMDSAMKTAEEQAGVSTKDVYCGVPGQFCRVYSVEVKTELQGADPKVTPRDIEMLFSMADADMREVRGVPIHRSPAWFVVDDGKKTLEPLNQHGTELRALISYVMADQFFIDDVSERMRAIGKNACGFFSTPMGEAMLYISDEDRDKTAILIDCGYLNTEVMAVEGDTLIFHKVLPLGGGHISADLAYGLEIPLESAEQVKRNFVFGDQNSKTAYDVTLANGAMKTFTRDQVKEILLPRMDEICEGIGQVIKDSGVRLGNWSPVYLTGGGLSINRGGKEYLGEKMERAVRDLPRKAVKLSSPIYSSALGLLDLIIDTRSSAAGQQSGIRAFFSGLFGA